MNISQITVLGDQLRQMGFKHLEVELLKRICFRLPYFELHQSIQRNTDLIFFNFRFRRVPETDQYSLEYYDVMLQKELKFSSTMIGDVDIASLELRMAAIDWKNIFVLDQATWTPDDKACWETATAIEVVCDELETLLSCEDGHLVASRLKFKYWTGHLGEDITGTIPTVKSKADVSQRFYFSPENSITIDEAYRFLQNKWIEKQLHEKSKTAKHSPLPAEKSNAKGRTKLKNEQKRPVVS